MPIQVYSTLTSDQRYTTFRPGDVPTPIKSVLIRGGSNVANKNLVTPFGVRTEITEDEFELLQKDKVFQMHVKNKFVKVTRVKADAEKVATDMANRDNSAPLVPQDFELSGEAGAKPQDVHGPEGTEEKKPVRRSSSRRK